MKRFKPFTLNRAALRDELEAFRLLLTPEDKELSERNDILPFFKKHLNLASLIGFAKPHLSAPDVLKSEFSFGGDHACDLAVGDSNSGQFCFIEFEDARKTSIFQGAKGVPDWTGRLEHGFSQIVDWFYILADQSQTKSFRSFFRTDLADYCGLLVIGRDRFVDDAQNDRLRWRSQHTLIDGKLVCIRTFDQLFRELVVRVDLFSPSPIVSPGTTKKQAKATKQKKSKASS